MTYIRTAFRCARSIHVLYDRKIPMIEIGIQIERATTSDLHRQNGHQCYLNSNSVNIVIVSYILINMVDLSYDLILLIAFTFYNYQGPGEPVFHCAIRHLTTFIF